MGKGRLEAFSDGVLAIIITIMILEIKVPHATDWEALRELTPVFISYVLSFLFVGIYWGNHHHLVHLVHRVNPAIMWANLNLLFWLSLIPVATGWMGESHFAQNTVITYAVLLLICGVAYTILQRAITATQPLEPHILAAVAQTSRKGYLSIAGYTAAIGCAFFSTALSCVLFMAVSIMWLIPDRSLERAIEGR